MKIRPKGSNTGEGFDPFYSSHRKDHAALTYESNKLSYAIKALRGRKTELVKMTIVLTGKVE